MGLARDLTMGPPRPRKARIGTTGPYAVVRRLVTAAKPDPAKLKAALDAIAASPNRLRYAEGEVYLAGCERYRALTGDDYGPRRGTY